MIKPILHLLSLLLLTSPSFELTSPCPDILKYEPMEPNPIISRWFGNVLLKTDTKLIGLQLVIGLDSPAELLSNTIGEVTSKDNYDFDIKNDNYQVKAGPPYQNFRFSVKYDKEKKPPNVQYVSLNGRIICGVRTITQSVSAGGSSYFDSVTGILKETSWSSSPLVVAFVEESNEGRVVVVENDVSACSSTNEESSIFQNTAGEVTTNNNYDFNIKNDNYEVKAGPPYQYFRFSVKYNKEKKPPNVDYVLLNGMPLCGKPTVTVGFSSAEAGGSAAYDPKTGVLTQTSWSSQHGKIVYNTSEIKPESKPTFPVRPTNTRPPPYPVLTTTERPVPILTKFVPAPCTNCGDDQYDADNAPINDDEYFVGGLPSAKDLEDAHKQTQSPYACGVVVKKPNPLIVNGRPTQAGEWPWQVALFLARNFESRYACGGTLVTLNYVTTAAHCVTRRKTNRVVPRNTITLYMGKHNLRTTIDGVQIRYVSQILVHEQYEPSTFNQDLALLKLHEHVTYTDTVRPACLWPQEQEDLSYVIGLRGTVVGWGYDGSGKTSEELTLVEMPVVAQDVCVRSHPLFFGQFTSITTYCAGYRNGSSACNGDSGGGMVFNLHGIWYLRGLVSLSVAKSREQHTCDPNHFIIFTDIAKSLKWIKDVILESEQGSYTKLFRN